MLKAHSAFIDNNLNLKCYHTLINKSTSNNNALPLIMTNNSETKVCLPKDMPIGTSEVNNNDNYSIIGITLTAKPDDIKTQMPNQ